MQFRLVIDIEGVLFSDRTTEALSMAASAGPHATRQAVCQKTGTGAAKKTAPRSWWGSDSSRCRMKRGFFDADNRSSITTETETSEIYFWKILMEESNDIL